MNEIRDHFLIFTVLALATSTLPAAAAEVSVVAHEDLLVVSFDSEDIGAMATTFDADALLSLTDGYVAAVLDACSRQTSAESGGVGVPIPKDLDGEWKPCCACGGELGNWRGVICFTSTTPCCCKAEISPGGRVVCQCSRGAC